MSVKTWSIQVFRGRGNVEVVQRRCQQQDIGVEQLVGQSGCSGLRVVLFGRAVLLGDEHGRVFVLGEVPDGLSAEVTAYDRTTGRGPGGFEDVRDHSRHRCARAVQARVDAQQARAVERHHGSWSERDA
jgi:hypothetical protein